MKCRKEKEQEGITEVYTERKREISNGKEIDTERERGKERVKRKTGRDSKEENNKDRGK